MGSSQPIFSSLYVAVGGGATILISTNAIHWTLVPTSYSCDLLDVSFSWPNFAAATWAGSTNAPNFLLSQQGTSWSGVFVQWNPYAGQNGYHMDTVCAGAGLLVAAGGTDFADDIWRSWDSGNSWDKVGFSNQIVNGIAYAYSNSRFVMIGWEGHPVISTNNGDSWFFSYDTNACPADWQVCNVGQDIAWTPSTFVVVRSWVPRGILTSNDGVNWTQRSALSGLAMDTVAVGNGQFVAAGANGIYRAELPPSISGSLTSSNSIHLVITSQPGRSYRLQSSSNLTSWTDVASFTGSSIPAEFYQPINTNLPALSYRVFEP